MLLAPGIETDPNQTNCDGCTPLCIAAGATFCNSHNNHEAVVALLLAPGVGTDPNQARNIDGATPLCIAAQGDNEAIVKLLLASGADRTVRTKNGTAAEIAAKHGHVAVVELLK